jgi:formylglycine-generating enzyme required for sulfatase activity
MPRVNEQIGPYTLIRQLGRGGFGVVWLAERRGALATTTVAIKLVIDDEPDIAAISQESQLWAQAGGHPNVLPIIEADIYDGQVVIVSEYAPSGSLDSWLKERGGIAPSLEIAVSIALGILSGLEHLHSKRIIHRDLKPANILLQGETPRLADFGLARVLKSSAHSGGIAGTPAYMSPEAFDGKRTEQADVWSVGVIFHQLVSGGLPFPSKDTVTLLRSIIMSEPVPPPSTLPEPFRKVIAHALQKSPARQYQSATEMRVALRNAISQTPGFAAIATGPLPPLNQSSGATLMEATLAEPPLSQPKPDFTATKSIATKPLLDLAPEHSNIGERALDNSLVDQPTCSQSLPILEMSAFIANPTVSVGAPAFHTQNVTSILSDAAASEDRLNFNFVALLGNGKIKERKNGQAYYFTESLGGEIALDLIFAPGGVFQMGSPFNEPRRESNEGPAHNVTVPSFYIGRFEITQGQWQTVANWPRVERDLSTMPSFFQGYDLPVEQISWDEAIEFCRRLTVQTGRPYRLPSEAEWEYACRAGNRAPFAFGDSITPEVANFNGQFPYSSTPKGLNRGKTTPVGSTDVANGFGLYDMHGNVWEWCQDIWHDNYEGAPTDGSAWEKGGDSSRRVLRGGSWYHPANNCRSASRMKSSPNVRSHYFGFRVVVSAA